MAKFGRIGWFFGLIFGTLLGVLFAPRKGKEFRDRIQKDRKKGGYGFEPLKEDVMKMGQEIVGLAKELYESAAIQDLISAGRKKMKDISGDLIDDVSDFHRKNIRPLERKVWEQLGMAHEKGKELKRNVKDVKKKVKASSHVAKKAVRQIKGIFQGKRKK